MLRTRIGRYIFISAVSVYRKPLAPPVAETDPRMTPAGEEVTEVEGEAYGALKVTCENLIEEIYGDRCTFLRPQIVAGPGDTSERYSCWIQRAMQGGEMLAPGDGSDHLQVIDIRDLAKFAETVIAGDLGGAFNLSGPRLTWAEFMNLLGVQDPVWVPSEIIEAAAVSEFELPLYRPAGSLRSGLMNVDNSRAVRAGLTQTAPGTTASDTRAWLSGKRIHPLLSPGLEAELIRIARQKAAPR
jgi:2'-hydroxyisoflavone reductase